MTRFKLKLNQNEMKALAGGCTLAARNIEKPGNAAELAMVETCERLWSRLRNIYRPDRDKYTIRLSAMEVHVLAYYVLTWLRNTNEPYLRTMGYNLQEELRKQEEREVNVFNAMRYGNE